MLNNKYFILIVACILVSCKTNHLTGEKRSHARNQIAIGSVGQEKDFILQKDFSNVAIPCFNNPIKLNVTTQSFTKQSFKAFTTAKAFQTAEVAVTYIDSLETKPKYLQIDIADKLAFIKALNSHCNIDVKSYLALNKHAVLITGISLALKQTDIHKITTANAVFLIENGLKDYALKLYKEDSETEILRFNNGIIFGYQTSHCCWQDNKKHRLHIVDLVSSFNDCPFKSYRSSYKAIKKTNPYKL